MRPGQSHSLAVQAGGPRWGTLASSAARVVCALGRGKGGEEGSAFGWEDRSRQRGEEATLRVVYRWLNSHKLEIAGRG